MKDRRLWLLVLAVLGALALTAGIGRRKADLCTTRIVVTTIDSTIVDTLWSIEVQTTTVVHFDTTRTIHSDTTKTVISPW